MSAYETLFRLHSMAEFKGDKGVLVPAGDLGDILDELATLRLRGNKGMVSFRTFLAQCKDRGEKPIQDGSAVFDYAEKAGIHFDILRVHWLEFKARYSDESKLYKDWRRAFVKSVRGNWFKLWYFDGNGACTLTTAGIQAKNSADAVLKRQK